MANLKKRVPENVPGDFFVDTTCIDCDACRQIAPSVFGEAAETSFVKARPVSSADQRQALRALLACPTGSVVTILPCPPLPGKHLVENRGLSHHVSGPTSGFR